MLRISQLRSARYDGLQHGAEHNRDSDNERGAALVEFALVAVLLLTIAFGVFEFGTAWSKSQLVTQAARSGGRTGAQVGTGLSSPGISADESIVQAVEAGLGGSAGNLQRIVIYKATDPDGALPPSCETVAPPGVAGLCSVYDAGDYANYGAWVDGAWSPASRDNGINTADFIGIRVEIEEPLLTGFFGTGTYEINDTAVFRIEPDAGD